jgi:pilus assembly protein TadC
MKLHPDFDLLMARLLERGVPLAEALNQVADETLWERELEDAG